MTDARWPERWLSDARLPVLPTGEHDPLDALRNSGTEMDQQCCRAVMLTGGQWVTCCATGTGG